MKHFLIVFGIILLISVIVYFMPHCTTYEYFFKLGFGIMYGMGAVLLLYFFKLIKIESVFLYMALAFVINVIIATFVNSPEKVAKIHIINPNNKEFKINGKTCKIDGELKTFAPFTLDGNKYYNGLYVLNLSEKCFKYIIVDFNAPITLNSNHSYTKTKTLKQKMNLVSFNPFEFENKKGIVFSIRPCK